MIDSFYRIRALHKIGVHIHLHCFEYGRKHSQELEALCATVNYYPRRSALADQLSLLPYIVSSRRSDALIENLTKDDYPILFDGLHTTYYLNHQSLAGRKKLVRLHNIEHRYYRSLADNEPGLLKKMYFLFEAYRLEKYEKVIRKADCIFTISAGDQEYFSSEYHNSVLLPPSHPYDMVESETGTGDYILYHGDLSVRENVSVASSLITDVFSKVPYSCVIAGKNPPLNLLRRVGQYSNIRVEGDPDNKKMTELIRHAQVNLLPVLSANGFKIKLLTALFGGRHCLVNSLAAESSGTGSLCHVADSAEELRDRIHLLMQVSFTEAMKVERAGALSGVFDNEANAVWLVGLVWEA